MDRTRVYWLLPGMDRRIGFAENVGGTTSFYYYLTDHVGTVLRIVKEDGTVANQYDYDAFGRVRWASANTWEQSGLENRYLFQGREWDKNGGFYYFRNRIYLPERGEFATPDMNLGRGILGELDGMATLTFCGGDPVNCIDPTGLTNEIGDFGTSVYSVNIGLFDEVRNLREEMWGFEVALPRRTTGIKCFNRSEINAVHEMDGYDVLTGGQASAALWSMQYLVSLLSRAENLLVKYGSLDSDTLTAINDTAYKMRDVETGWNEYASKSGNFIDMETGRPRSNAGLRNLTTTEIQEIYYARAGDYESRNPVMGLESTFLDPTDIVFSKLAAGAFVGKTALGVFSKKLPVGVGNATKTGVWRLTSAGSDKVMFHNKFGKFFRSKSDGLWWVEDTAGHGGSAFKVYRETGKGLVWYRDADQFGNFILLKHKSDVGTFLPWKEMAGVK